MTRWLLPALVLILVAGPLAGSSGALMEHRYLYFPEKRLDATPAAAGLPYEEVSFLAADGVRLHGWFVPGETGQPLVLFCHGNAGNISHRIDNLLLFRRELGVSVLIFDYRGYGRSDGRADEEGTYDDARGALAWAEAGGWQSGRIIYFGRSMGAAVALQLAIEAPPAAVVLESPFTSVAAMGWRHYPLLYGLIGWLFDARYDNLAKIGRLRSPLLIFHGERDAIVPEAMARRLYERAPGPKRYVGIPGAGHNDTYEQGGAGYWRAWRELLAEIRTNDAAGAPSAEQEESP